MSALVHIDDEANSRLTQLGLELEWITRALQRGDAESRTVSQMAPKGFEGTTRWGRVAEFLREDLCSRDWTPDDTHNIARSISPTGEISVVVTTGSKGTGVDGPDPSTKYTKGAGFAASIETNLTLDLEFTSEVARTLGIAPSTDSPMQTWLLLFMVEKDVIYAELSMPDAISDDGQITSWRERILLPRIELTPPPMLGEENGPTDPVDVPVSRR